MPSVRLQIKNGCNLDSQSPLLNASLAECKTDVGKPEITFINVNLKTESQMSVDLLGMLAEVASNSLQHDACLVVPSKSHLSASKGARNTTNRLLRLFSKFDGDEMRRRFTFTCLFDIEECEMSFSSFGSELKARQCMKSHLFDHVQQAGGTSDGAFYKQRKLRAKKNPVVRRGSKSNLEQLQPDSIPKQKLDKKIRRVASSGKTKSSTAKHTSKMQQCDFKHFCGKAKCDKSNRSTTQPYVYVIQDEHNYTTHQTTSAAISSDTCSVALHDQHIIEIVDTDEDKNVKSTLNSFMLCEANHLNVLVACLENNNHSQLTKLPPVGEEVSIITTNAPGYQSFEGLKSDIDLSAGTVPSEGADTNFVDSEKTSDCGNASADVTARDSLKLTTGTKQEKLAQKKLTDKEMAIKLIAEAKYKGSAQTLCTICTPHRQFTALTTLISHYRSHAGIKPFECPVCQRSFTRQHSLKYHLLIHQNATRFTCTYCARKFRHPAHFREHLRKHTGEEPFHCCDCQARFKTRNTFKRHLRSRHSKVLTASGEVFQLEDDTEKTTQPPHDDLQLTSDEQDRTPLTENLESTGQDVDKENTPDWDAKAEGGPNFETVWGPSEIVVGFMMEEINQDGASAGINREVSNDGNNNATNQSAFFNQTSKYAISVLPQPPIMR